jgi:CBS domain containing-hemolysin-like protein
MNDLIPGITITLILSAFFSGIEIAYLAANRLRIELMSQKGDIAAKITLYFVQNPSRFMTTTLVGNNIALIMYGVLSARIIEYNFIKFGWISPENHFLIFVAQTVISSIFVLIIAEFIPKSIFRSNPNTLLYFLAIPFIFFYYLFYPVVKLLDYLSRSLLNAFFNLKLSTQSIVYTRFDLMHYVEQSNPVDIDDPEQAEVDATIFKNAIEFHTVQVRECMTPRTELTGIDVLEDVAELKKMFIESGHSKILIYKDSIDNIIGYVHQVDLFKNPVSIDKIVMPIIIAPESMAAQDLLSQFLDKHKSMAVVVDEFGGTAGIVTVEDILEEIIGDIEDEHDTDNLLENKISDTEFEFNARLEIDYLNEEYGLKIPEGDYDTLGGFILDVHQDIPKIGEVIESNPYSFTILTMDKTKIQDVRLIIHPKEN